MQVKVRDGEKIHGTYENQHDPQVRMTRLGVIGVIFRRNLLVYCIEFKTGISILIRFGEDTGSILDAMSAQTQ